MRLRHQSVSHVRSESQRSVNYNASRPRSSGIPAMSPVQRFKSWKSLAAVLILLGALNLFLAKSVRQVFATANLHLVIPATNSNKYLCQLLFSSVILKYPTPVLVNWDSPDSGDSPQRYISKVEAINKYINHFPPAKDNDLILVVDGFDVWFQLPPDVILRRYFAAIAAQNKRLAARLGSSAMKKHDIQQSILFSADKECGPKNEGSWVGCWAAPESTLPIFSYGPYNDSSLDAAKQDPHHTRPRWLSSGVIIGPVKDMRLLFAEMVKLMHAQPTSEPDQWFYSQIFGTQEHSRALLESNPRSPPDGASSPEIGRTQRTEFHMGLDYESGLFQTVGHNDQYLTWWQHDGSKDNAVIKKSHNKRLHPFKLSQDVSNARRPFESMLDLKMSAYNEKYQRELMKAGRPNFKSWKHLPLATNVITRHVFALMHFTFEKDYRDIWWEKMWFFPYGRDLMYSAGRVTAEPLYKSKINGQKWYGAQTPVSPFIAGSNQERRDGAWNEQGEWKYYSSLCSAHDEAIFGTSFDSSVLNYNA